MTAHSQNEHQQCPHLLSNADSAEYKIASGETVRILGSSFGDDAGSHAQTPSSSRVQQEERERGRNCSIFEAADLCL